MFELNITQLLGKSSFQILESDVKQIPNRDIYQTLSNSQLCFAMHPTTSPTSHLVVSGPDFLELNEEVTLEEATSVGKVWGKFWATKEMWHRASKSRKKKTHEDVTSGPLDSKRYTRVNSHY